MVKIGFATHNHLFDGYPTAYVQESKTRISVYHNVPSASSPKAFGCFSRRMPASDIGEPGLRRPVESPEPIPPANFGNGAMDSRYR